MQDRENDAASTTPFIMQLKKMKAGLSNYAYPQSYAYPKKSGLFGFVGFGKKSADTGQVVAQELYRTLNPMLHNHMNLDELAKVLLLLQSIPVDKNFGDLGTLLEQSHMQMLEHIPHYNNAELRKLKSEVRTTFTGKLDPESQLADFLTSMYANLFDWYKMTLERAFSDKAASAIEYTPEMLDENQVNHELMEYSKRPHPNDLSTVTTDIIRLNISINRSLIYPQENEADMNEAPSASEGAQARINYDRKTQPNALSAIEKFTGDKIDDPTSKANKIYFFGGQHLWNTFGDEFGRNTQNVETGHIGYQYQKTVGHLDWYNDPDTGDLKAKVETKIYTMRQLTDDGWRTYMIGSDGSSLAEIKADDEEVIGVKKKELKANLPYTSMLPICEISGEVTLKKGDNGYHLEITKFNIKYNTPDLVSTHDHSLQLQGEKEAPQTYKPTFT